MFYGGIFLQGVAVCVGGVVVSVRRNAVSVIGIAVWQGVAVCVGGVVVSVERIAVSELGIAVLAGCRSFRWGCRSFSGTYHSRNNK